MPQPVYEWRIIHVYASARDGTSNTKTSGTTEAKTRQNVGTEERRLEPFVMCSLFFGCTWAVNRGAQFPSSRVALARPKNDPGRVSNNRDKKRNAPSS